MRRLEACGAHPVHIIPPRVINADVPPAAEIRVDVRRDSSGFYLLTPLSPQDDVWMGWQGDRPDRGESVVQAFRRPGSIYESARLKLHGLETHARYRVTDLKTGQVDHLAGQALAESGRLVTLASQPGSAMLVHKRL